MFNTLDFKNKSPSSGVNKTKYKLRDHTSYKNRDNHLDKYMLHR